MKKVKSNLKVVFAFILGVIAAHTTVYAATILFDSVNVGYDNTNTGLQDSNGNDVEDVQTAIDELYETAKEYSSDIYVFGTPATGSTTNYTLLDKTVFIKSKNSVNSVCILKNGLHCFDDTNNSYTISKLRELFGNGNCTENEYLTRCSDDTYSCAVYNDSGLECSNVNSCEFCSADNTYETFLT